MLKKYLGNKNIEQKCKVALLQMQLIRAEQNAHNFLKEAATQQSSILDIV